MQAVNISYKVLINYFPIINYTELINLIPIVNYKVLINYFLIISYIVLSNCSSFYVNKFFAIYYGFS